MGSRTRTPEPLWELAFVLPNLELAAPIDAGPMALTPVSDKRVQEFVARYRHAASFLKRFTTPFREPIAPAVLLIRRDGPIGIHTREAAYGLRDAIAVSAICDGRARAVTARFSRSACYSDTFEFYPVYLGRDNEHLITDSMAVTGLDSVSDFLGQSSAALRTQTGLDPEMNVDAVLFEALIAIWKKCHVAGESSKATKQLFRSLNAAYHACALPMNANPGLFDLAPVFSSWVSAFETLCYGEQGGVLGVLSKVAWNATKLKALDYKLGNGKLGNLPAALYSQLRGLRDKFLHGSEISHESLAALGRKGKRLVSDYATLVFRQAVLSRLGIHPTLLESEGISRWTSNRRTEAALLSVLDD